MTKTDDVLTPLDAMVAKNFIQIAQDLLTEKQFSACIAAAQFDLPQIMSVTGRGQGEVEIPQFGRFCIAINQKCGEPTLRLLNRNFGSKFVALMRTIPLYQNLKDRYADKPQSERINATVRDFIALTTTLGFALSYEQQDAKSWLIISRPCFVCYGLQTQKPICATSSVIYKEIVSWATGVSLLCEEITCRATGGDDCSYLLRTLE